MRTLHLRACRPVGLWNTYDPRCLDLDYFLAYPLEACKLIREIFYDYFGMARPNKAHEVFAAWEARGARDEGFQESRIKVGHRGWQNSLQSVLNNEGETE